MLSITAWQMDALDRNDGRLARAIVEHAGQHHPDALGSIESFILGQVAAEAVVAARELAIQGTQAIGAYGVLALSYGPRWGQQVGLKHYLAQRSGNLQAVLRRPPAALVAALDALAG